jgi:hypothetical protein
MTGHLLLFPRAERLKPKRLQTREDRRSPNVCELTIPKTPKHPLHESLQEALFQDRCTYVQIFVVRSCVITLVHGKQFFRNLGDLLFGSRRTNRCSRRPLWLLCPPQFQLCSHPHLRLRTVKTLALGLRAQLGPLVVLGVIFAPLAGRLPVALLLGFLGF